MDAADDRTIRIRLQRPFPLLLDALARVGSNAPFMMPERVAMTDAFQQITETVGSGPFRFRRDEWVSGSFAAWERNPDYVPRSEPAEWTAGGKRALVDRVEWRIVPDPATAAAALQAGEVDWWDNPIADLLPVLQRNRSIVLEQVNILGEIGTLRFNHLQPPFNNLAIRRAVAMAMDQRSYMQAAVGTDKDRWRAGVGIFTPETPLASDEGMEILNRPRDLAAARRALEQAGYRGERVVLMGPTDLPIVFAQAQVTAQLFRDLGMDLDFVATDFGTIIQRRTSKAVPERGGWSAFHTFWLAFDHLNPAAHVILRGNGENAWFGWPTSPDIEQLREAWFDASDLDTQKTIAARLQAAALRDLPYVPTGQWFVPTAYRNNVRGILRGPGLQHWNVEKTA
jgi:peptide/nickel transport system substrate-binding protein